MLATPLNIPVITYWQARRQGRFRIARELRGRGVPDERIDAALAAVFADTDESALVRDRLKRRLSHLRGALDEKKIASLYRMLLRAGFSSDVIRKELRGVTHGDLRRIPRPSRRRQHLIIVPFSSARMYL